MKELAGKIWLLLFISFISAGILHAAEWNWEDGTLQGWLTKKDFNGTGLTTGLTNTTEKAFEGTHSLKYQASGSSTNNWDWYTYVSNPGLTAGDPVYFHAWVPSGVNISGLKIYMRAADSSWVDGTFVSVENETWMEMVIDVPTNVPMPILEVGLQVHTTGNPANFYLYLDYVISGIPAAPTGLTANALDSTSIQLDWDDNQEVDFWQYKIYRADFSGFPTDSTTFIDSTQVSDYLDLGLTVNTRYYYKVTALDSAGNESNPSGQVSVYLSTPGAPPVVTVQNVNTNTPLLYEKFEAILDLQNANYSNPFDPDEIDIRAYFISPSGDTLKTFGFYDNYMNAAKWKVRFAPNEIGSWSYYIIASEADGADTTDIQTFDAMYSDHHGWVQVSDDNPRYFEYDDDTDYYGVGVYSPWGNSVSRFNDMKNYGFNMFGIWNITYGGFTNAFGLLETNLADYNQQKCGRIDSMIVISEQSGFHIMYCIWPHDVFSATVWATQWQNNPYRFLCNAEDVYSDPDAWEYQKKLYRYMIARFAYSRGWGVWEIINEMNGTDGWAQGYTDEAYAWVQKVDTYMKENDPYNHPTTASFSGGFNDYRPPLYDRIDIPNIHVYEHQGWPSDYDGNPFRSSLHNFAFASQRFWNNFDKPSIFGEAGASSYFERYGFNYGSPEYNQIYHNSLWSSVTNGLAMAPVWWDYPALVHNDFIQLSHFRTFTDATDFRNTCKNHSETITDDYDLFLMHSDTSAIGWVRQSYGSEISGQLIKIDSVFSNQYSSYEIRYFNTWTGNWEQTHIRPYINDIMLEVLPEFSTSIADVAFQVTPAEPGTVPARLEVLSTQSKMFNNNSDTTIVFSYIFDEQSRYCNTATNQVTYTLAGPGTLVGPNPVNSVNGSSSIKYVPSSQTGTAKIIVSATGLTSDTVQILINNQNIVEDFEAYSSNSQLQTIWQAQNGTTITATLESGEVGSGQYAGRFDYDLNNVQGYSMVLKQITKSYTPESKFLAFWIKPDNSNREITIRIRDNNRKSMEYSFDLTGTQGEYKIIPFADFAMSDTLDMTDLDYFRFTIRPGNGTMSSGSIILDDIQFLTEAVSIPIYATPVVPEEFQLFQNYPNPFNNATKLRYAVPAKGDVELTIYNMLGQKVKTLVNEIQTPGTYTVEWQGDNIASGIYFYRLKAKNANLIKKCMLIK